MTFARRVFQIAAIYGFLGILPQFFTEAKAGRDFPPPVTHPEFYYGFLGVALAWQVLFLILAQDPVRYRPMMLPAILEKLAFGVAVIALYLASRAPALLVGFGAIDLLFAGLFWAAWRKTGQSS